MQLNMENGKRKIRVEGLTFSMQGFVGTIAAGIVTAVIGWVLNFSKYDGTLSFADTQAGSAVLAIKTVVYRSSVCCRSIEYYIVKILQT